MKASKFTDAQKAFIIKQGEDGSPVAEVCRKAGISQATYLNWKKKYAGLMPSEMKRLRELEEENARLKKIVADRWRSARQPRQGNAPGRHQAKALRPVRKRTLVDEMRADWQVSIRRACAVCVLATAACTSCCAGTAGRSRQRRPKGFTGSWACSSGTRRRNGG